MLLLPDSPTWILFFRLARGYSKKTLSGWQVYAFYEYFFHFFIFCSKPIDKEDFGEEKVSSCSSKTKANSSSTIVFFSLQSVWHSVRFIFPSLRKVMCNPITIFSVYNKHRIMQGRLYSRFDRTWRTRFSNFLLETIRHHFCVKIHRQMFSHTKHICSLSFLSPFTRFSRFFLFSFILNTANHDSFKKY